MAPQLKLLAETTASVDEIAQILRAEHGDPFHILGMHLVEFQGKPAVAIRAFLPRTHDAWVVRGPGAGEAVPLRRIHADGFFEAVFPGEQAMFPYRLRTDYAGQHEFEDPYRFPPSCPTSIFTCWRKARTTRPTKSWARTSWKSPECAACRSRCGRRMPYA